MPFAFLVLLAAAALLTTPTLRAVEPAVRWTDGRFATADGQPVTLRGVNLGCWLLLEPWMLRIEGVRDQQSLVRAWHQRHGEAWGIDFRERLRQAWIRPDDLAVAKRAGFNTVRIPFDSRPLMREEGPIEVQEAGFAGLDAAIAMAEAAGFYIIIDLHGAPGGQCDDQPTGERGRNFLWTSADAQARTAAIWKTVARRYRDRPLLIAYDLINEPYGSIRGEEHIAVHVFDQLVKAVRSEDQERLIFVAGTSAGVLFYGNPTARGWTNTGLTEHYYPGLYGAPETVEVHQDFLTRFIPRMAEDLKGIPFLVGEFNPVVASAGAPASTRAHFDTYARHGWAATMWSLRWNTVAGGNGNSDWCFIANRDPLPPINATTASKEDWEAWLRVVAGPRSVHEGMVSAFGAAQAPAFPLPAEAAVPAPATGPLPTDWTTTALGFTRRTSAGTLADGRWRLVSTSRDLHAAPDAALFVHRPAPAGAWSITSRIDRLDASGQHAKGGLMVRQGLTVDGAFAALHAFPDGRVCLAVRGPGDAKASETIDRTTGFPVEVRLRWNEGQVVAEFRRGSAAWTTLGQAPWATANGQYVGLVHNANHGVIPGALDATAPQISTP